MNSMKLIAAFVAGLALVFNATVALGQTQGQIDARNYGLQKQTAAGTAALQAFGAQAAAMSEATTCSNAKSVADPQHPSYATGVGKETEAVALWNAGETQRMLGEDAECTGQSKIMDANGLWNEGEYGNAATLYIQAAIDFDEAILKFNAAKANYYLAASKYSQATYHFTIAGP
jgi:hypothetical protein